jgi:hypothetical protein
MAFELFFKRASSNFGDGIIFQEYNDKFFLIAGGKGHQVWKRYCFPQKKDKQPTDKPIPMSVNLGDRYEAIDLLEKFLKALKPSNG